MVYEVQVQMVPVQAVQVQEVQQVQAVQEQHLGRLPALGMIFQDRVMVTFLWLTSPLPSSQK